MADPRYNALDILAQMHMNSQAEQSKLQQLASEPIRNTFLNEGQSGMDALRNPDDMQSRALLQGALSMLASDPGNPSRGMSEGIASGMNLFDTMKAKERERGLTAAALGVQGANTAFGQVKDILGAIPDTSAADQAAGVSRYLADKAPDLAELAMTNPTEAMKLYGERTKPAPVTPPTYEEKQVIKHKREREAELVESRNPRLENIKKAAEFLGGFEGGARSGKGRSTLNLSWLPTPTVTEQGRFDEALNAFAETAARAALKASGETKPTDDDVKGMKRAMFGVGTDEEVNKKLLGEFITAQIADENELRAIEGQPPIEPPKITPKKVGGVFDAVWSKGVDALTGGYSPKGAPSSSRFTVVEVTE